MKDFVQYCLDKGLVEVHDDGTVSWTEASCCHKEPVKAGKKISHKEKLSGAVRDARTDLSSDYQGNSAHNGTVWPFKVAAKGKGKAVAPVAK